jgi:hypothetical protein
MIKNIYYIVKKNYFSFGFERAIPINNELHI